MGCSFLPVCTSDSVTDTAFADNGVSSVVSSWIVMSTGPARPGETVTLAIAFSVWRCVKKSSLPAAAEGPAVKHDDQPRQRMPNASRDNGPRDCRCAIAIVIASSCRDDPAY